MNLSSTHHPMLTFVKKTSPYNTALAFDIRTLDIDYGIRWDMVSPIFIRNGWQIEQQEDIFIQATHRHLEHRVMIYRSEQGYVRITCDNITVRYCELHELEDFAEI